MKHTSDLRAGHAFSGVRLACLCALLAAEFVAASLRFDSRLVPETRPWHGLATEAGTVARFGIVALSAALMFTGATLRHELSNSRAWSFLSNLYVLGNLSCFTVFFAASALVLEGPSTPITTSWSLFAIWLAAGFTTIAFWAMAALPVVSWIRLVKLAWPRLLAGSIFGIAAYAASYLARDQWTLLSIATLHNAHALLRLVLSDVVFDPARRLLGTSQFEVEVGPECSGYEGMALIIGLVVVALWAFRREFRFPRAFLLLPVAAVLMWLANAVRIAALVLIGNAGHPELAVGGFHSLAGWFFFLVIGLGLIAVARRTPYLSRRPAEGQEATGGSDAAYLVPAMALIATSMVTSTLSPGIDLYYPVRIIVVAVVLAAYRKHYSELRMSISWQAIAIGCGVFALWMVLEPFAAISSSSQPPAALLSINEPARAVWLFFRVSGSVIAVPLAEELAFRGYLTRRLIDSDFQTVSPGRLTFVSFLVSSLLFGVLHGRWFAGTLAGMSYALAYHRRGVLIDAVLAHAVTNGLIAIAVLVAGQWSLWA
jgi:exosortase E/protease (VPEID-CTERM system)